VLTSQVREGMGLVKIFDIPLMAIPCEVCYFMVMLFECEREGERFCLQH
jgi:hypothetical protein